MIEPLRDLVKRMYPDYPLDDNADVYTCIWALETGAQGTVAANAMCHKFIRELSSRLGIEERELYDQFGQMFAKED